MEGSPAAFEQSLAKRLREELDTLHVAVPASRPRPVRAMRMAFASAAALAVGAALLLGTVAAFASGSPDPRVWMKDAERTFGVPLVGEHSPMGAQSSPEPSPEPKSEAPAGTGEQESPSPAQVVHETPEPARPEASPSPELGERSPTSSGDG